ncbi:glutamyl-tRNA reductase [Allopseudospirillum japonicum]|uniref:Glutamyl-tRNA reductase n=1 Tax=Allopseudospirillum japonicum TaxID=64971 RepID=A0A1H6RWM1_9GAMM|nr:glutamyl-tRNA reductase [Allopseudospirillum japonicum]SEI60163.1 glutamyl-tRNA reductase [Allopseudospirillum japonicum]
MTFLALGINHKTAPVDIRERVAFTPEELAKAFQHLKQQTWLREVAILSTCNRTELYLYSNEASSTPALEWLCDYHQLGLEELVPCCYRFQDVQAARHLMRVACGLDSMVLGEPQILGQLKDAYTQAHSYQTLGSGLQHLFQQAFAIAKQVRTQTAIGENPVSVAYAAVNLAQHIFSDLSESRALLVGAGETIELVARHLHQAGVDQLVVANRTFERAQALAEHFTGAQATLLSDLPHQLEKADIVITSTASQLPILGKGMVERALKVRRHRPIFMVDIAVPRDIEPQVGELDDVYLYSVDDLQSVIEENRRSRQQAAQEAENLIEQALAKLEAQNRIRDVGHLIRAYRQQAQDLCQQEVAQALAALQQGADPHTLLPKLAHSLTNKLLHTPTVRLRQASADNQQEVLAAAPFLLGLQDPPAS